MCYATPGPRCSAHATAELKKKQAELNAALGSPYSFKAYEALAEAERHYYMTPAGHKDLQSQIDAEQDEKKREVLEEKLRLGKAAREEAIAEAKAAGVTSGGHQKPAKEEEAEKPKLPLAAVPSSNILYQPVTPPWNKYFYGKSKAEERANREAYMALINNYIIKYDYRQTYPDWGCDCPEDDYCRCKVLEFEGFPGPVHPETFARAVFNVRWDEDIPDELVKPFDGWDLENHLEPVAEGGYYGEEFAGLEMSQELKKEVERVSRSIPNAADIHWTYEYARQEGVDTTGLTPVEAAKKAVNTTTLPSDLADKVKGAKQVRSVNVRLSQVDTTAFNLDGVEAYDYSSARNSPDLSAGVLYRVGSKKYQLVGGPERFQAVRNSGHKNWYFQILTDD